MPTDVIMPALGVAQEKGTLINWLKAEGQLVTKGEPLMEVETDKATVEIEAPASGILTNVSAFPGDEIPVGNRIAVILAPGEKPAHPHPRIESGAGSRPLSKGEGITEGRRLGEGEGTPDTHSLINAEGITQSHPLPVAEGRGEGQPAGKKIPASPVAKRIAKERGLNLASINGSGPGGSVLARDVVNFAAPQLVAGREPAACKQTIQLTSMRRIVGERMTKSKQSAPHFYLSLDADMTQVTRSRESLKAEGEQGIPSINDFILHAAARALREFSSLNAAFSNEAVEVYSDINIGMAVALEDGLVVPVIRNADRLALAELAKQSRQLVEKAQNKKLLPADYEGGTLTISNLGMFGIDSFIAIINPPQCAILAVGRLAPRVVAYGEGIAVRPMMTMTLSADHRVVDGAIAARFLQAVKKQLEKEGS